MKENQKKQKEKGKLTEKEQAILGYILKFKKQYGYVPTVREMCKGVGYSSTSTVQSHLTRIEEKGYIRRDPTKPRALEILIEERSLVRNPSCKTEPQHEDKIRMIKIPVLGEAACGQPIYAEQNPDGFCILPEEDFHGKDQYMLRVHGSSMINAGIMDGDLVVVEACDCAENGDIVVALVDDSATIKRFYKEDGHYRLQPENDSMEPIIVDHVKIQGVVVGLTRSLRRIRRG